MQENLLVNFKQILNKLKGSQEGAFGILLFCEGAGLSY